MHSLLGNAAEAASLEKAHGHGVRHLHSFFTVFFFFTVLMEIDVCVV